MPALPQADLDEVYALFANEGNCGGPLSDEQKSVIKQAFASGDAWIDGAGGSSFNSALPVAFRTNATTAQKARLLSLIIERRYMREI